MSYAGAVRLSYPCMHVDTSRLASSFFIMSFVQDLFSDYDKYRYDPDKKLSCYTVTLTLIVETRDIYVRHTGYGEHFQKPSTYGNAIVWTKY